MDDDARVPLPNLQNSDSRSRGTRKTVPLPAMREKEGNPLPRATMEENQAISNVRSKIHIPPLTVYF